MKTIVVKEVESMIDEYSKKEVIESIETLSQWTKVADMYKFQTPSKMLKVQFKNTSMAQMAIKEGMVFLNQRIQARRIESEIFAKITSCNNCYAHDHDTKQCPKEKKCCFVHTVEKRVISRATARVRHQGVSVVERNTRC